MNKFIKYRFLLFSLLLTQLSCNKTKEFEIKNYQPMLVIEGYLHNNKPITVSVKRNLSPNDKVGDYPITDAKIIIWEDSMELGTMQHDSNGIYSFNYIPRNNHYYKLRAEHEYFPTAEAVTYVKEPIQVKIINSEPTDNSYKRVRIKLMQDNSNRFYGFQMAEKSLNFSYCYYQNGDKYFYLFYPTNYFPGIEFVCQSYFRDDEIAESTFQFINDNESAGDILFGSSKSLTSSYMTLETISLANTLLIHDLPEDVYQLFRSMVIYKKNTESSLTSPFYIPSAIHSNIKNGLGIFGYIFTYEFQIDSIPTSCF